MTGPSAGAAAIPPPLGLATEDYVNLRSGPDTGSRILAQLPIDTRVEIIGGQHGWYQVQTPWGSSGWLLSDYLALVPATDAATIGPDPQRIGTGNVPDGPLILRTGPGSGYASTGRLSLHEQVDVLAQQGDWYQVHSATGDSGWVAAEYVALDRPLAANGSSPQPPSSAASSDAVRIAYKYLGVRYVWGGWQPSGFDCSGLTKYVYAQLGVWLPGTAEAQLDSAYGRIISSVSALRPGDLVYFERTTADLGITHAGIYFLSLVQR